VRRQRPTPDLDCSDLLLVPRCVLHQVQVQLVRLLGCCVRVGRYLRARQSRRLPRSDRFGSGNDPV
jgi:hypothetical protein